MLMLTMVFDLQNTNANVPPWSGDCAEQEETHFRLEVLQLLDKISNALHDRMDKMDDEISKIGRSLAEMRDSSMTANKKVGYTVRGRIETSLL